MCIFVAGIMNGSVRHATSVFQNLSIVMGKMIARTSQMKLDAVSTYFNIMSKVSIVKN